MLTESSAASPMANGETPGLTCLSPGLVARDTPPPSESGYGPDDYEAYVLPPLHIDTSPISLQLPLRFCPVEHQLYEVKAPPPVSLPYRLAFENLSTEVGDCEQTLKQDQDETVSIAGSLVLSSILSHSPQLFSRENSQSSLLNDTSDTSISPCPCPSLSRSTFREESPSPPLSTSTVKAVVPRCSPPRSNAHAAFPSPPPTPPAEVETLPVFEASTAFQVLDAPIPRRPHLPTRRYLAPAFVRGEILPFAIAEELEEDEDEVKTGAVAKSFAEGNGKEGMVNGRAEPETSGSEYSTESAVRLESGGQVASTESSVHRSRSARSVNRAPSSIHRVGSKKGNKRRRRAGLLAMEVHAKRTASGISKLNERMKNFVGINRGLRIRDRT